MTQDSIIKEYLKNDKPWFLAYSGGKDSTAVLMLTYEAIKSIKHHNKIITIIYCDTGVEIPCVSTYTKKCLENFQTEIEKDNLPFKIVIAKPKIEDRFFSVVLGKGYVPPSFMFRWCTNRMRISPVQAIVGKEDNVILLGTRIYESIERSKTLKKYKIEDAYFKQKNYPKSLIYSPVADFSTDEI